MEIIPRYARRGARSCLSGKMRSSSRLCKTSLRRGKNSKKTFPRSLSPKRVDRPSSIYYCSKPLGARTRNRNRENHRVEHIILSQSTSDKIRGKFALSLRGQDSRQIRAITSRTRFAAETRFALSLQSRTEMPFLNFKNVKNTIRSFGDDVRVLVCERTSELGR